RRQRPNAAAPGSGTAAGAVAVRAGSPPRLRRYFGISPKLAAAAFRLDRLVLSAGYCAISK
ncbi:hypothetical protein, partial [Burkholderia glumae]|uniref:hypothetical protein n=1 Tax=Burkholderia glumae TaxID=337 RepID=UPI0019D6EFE6